MGLLTKLRQNREEADYRLRVPKAQEVERQVERAERFVEAAASRVEGR